MNKQHFRNFLGEMVKRGKSKGFEELDPNNTARLLFSNLHQGDRVAITARSSDEAAAQPYLNALQQRNVSARLITGQSDVHDFCFLKSAQRELVGTVKSTFVQWAGFLSTTPVPVRLYAINSTATRRAHGVDWHIRHCKWTHPGLRGRVSCEVYEQT